MMVRMQIQPRNLTRWSENNAQLQLCVPQVLTEGKSLRLAEATAGKGVTPLT